MNFETWLTYFARVKSPLVVCQHSFKLSSGKRRLTQQRRGLADTSKLDLDCVNGVYGATVCVHTGPNQMGPVMNLDPAALS